MDDGVEDGEADAFTSADGKADGYELTEAEALAVLRVASDSTEAQLKTAGLSARAAKNIASYRARPYDSLQELDGISYVGPRTLEVLLDHAKSGGRFDESALGRHDISVLVPLPASGDLPWQASSPGRGGALLPRTAYDKIGRSVFREIEEAAEYDALRVVAVRFDPCFTTSLAAPCQPQIRLVFQTLAQDRAEGTNDGAVHALYNLTADSFADVTARLRALAAPQNDPYQPLGISPVLKAEGMTGAYAQALGKILEDHAGPATLARMTFVTRTMSRQGQWELGGFHIKATDATGFPGPGSIKIVGSAETLQVIGNPGFGGINYSITPSIADPAGLPGTSAFSINDLTAAQRKTVAAWAFKQEAPTMTVPDTTDCASCHIAGHTTRMLEDVDAGLVTLDRGPRVIGGAETLGDNLRAFGYFGKEPMVSIRTANETAAVMRGFAAATR
jgi:hypothetical protein